MEEKKTIKVSLGTAICIFIILLLLISIVIMCYSNKNKDVSDEDKTSVSSKNLTKKSNIKIDDNRDLIYDANYLYKNFSDESYYSENMNKSYSLKDINLPYININSEDANNANKEIKTLFEELAENFEQEYKNTKTWYNIASYKTYTKGNLLSILITVESGGTDVEQYKYYAKGDGEFWHKLKVFIREYKIRQIN